MPRDTNHDSYTRHELVVLPLVALFLLSFFVPANALPQSCSSAPAAQSQSPQVCSLRSSLQSPLFRPCCSWWQTSPFSSFSSTCSIEMFPLPSLRHCLLLESLLFYLLSAILFVIPAIIIVSLYPSSCSPGLPVVLWSSSLLRLFIVTTRRLRNPATNEWYYECIQKNRFCYCSLR